MNIISNEKYKNEVIKTNFTQKQVAEYLRSFFSEIFDYEHITDRISFFNGFTKEGSENIVGKKDRVQYKVKLIKKAKFGEDPYENNWYEIILNYIDK